MFESQNLQSDGLGSAPSTWTGPMSLVENSGRAAAWPCRLGWQMGQGASQFNADTSQLEQGSSQPRGAFLGVRALSGARGSGCSLSLVRQVFSDLA